MEVALQEWNRKLVSEVIDALESSKENTDELIKRLRGFLAINPGVETIPPAEVAVNKHG